MRRPKRLSRGWGKDGRPVSGSLFVCHSERSGGICFLAVDRLLIVPQPGLKYSCGMAFSANQRIFSVLLLILALAGQAHAQPASTLPVLMLSDLHFDPFRDPAKVPKLAEAPVDAWEKILAAPETPGRAEAYQALEAACKAKGEDSDFALIESSLAAEKAAMPNPRFVTISGDLLVHKFDCRYNAVMKTGKGYAEFAEKTASFVVRSVEQTFPKAPVYVGMGNNDSSCGDYRMDAGDRYFAGTGKAIAAGMIGAPATDAAQALKDYEAGGYYSVALPGMTHPTRLLVLDDIFLSREYKTCAGKADTAGAAAMMNWLTAQLDAARKAGERVWVMGHIPPGVNVYGTLRKGNVCANSPDTYLAAFDKTTLADVLGTYADTIALALFGHTHMDEMKVIRAAGSEAAVPLKQVSSITPVNGNRPSFTVAQIDPANSRMADYAVYTAASAEGSGAWKRAYDFDAAYHQPAFSGAALETMVSGFHADSDGQQPGSLAYERFFDAGFPISPLVLGWPQYVCGMDHMGAKEYKSCACPAQ